MSFTTASTYNSDYSHCDHLTKDIDLSFVVGVAMPGIVRTSVADEGSEVDRFNSFKVDIIDNILNILRIFNK